MGTINCPVGRNGLIEYIVLRFVHLNDCLTAPDEKVVHVSEAQLVAPGVPEAVAKHLSGREGLGANVETASVLMDQPADWLAG